MPNLFVVVSGLPASGKTTLGRALARELRLPLIDKDEILEALFESLGVGDPAWRQKLSREADEELRRQAEASAGAILASWWRHPRSSVESGTRTDWLASLPGELVEVQCVCRPSVAANRFLSRQRHAGHLDGQKDHAGLKARFEQQAALGPLALGRIVQVNTETMPRIDDVLGEIAGWPSEGKSLEPTEP